MIAAKSWGSDFRRIGYVSQKMFKIAEEHNTDTRTKVIPKLLARTELGPAILIATIA